MTRRDFLVRADGEFVRNSLGRLVKFTEDGAHRWANRRKPSAYSVVRLLSPGANDWKPKSTDPEANDG